MGSFKNYITSFWKGLLSLLKGMGVTGKYFFSRKVTRKMKRSMKNGKEAIQTR